MPGLTPATGTLETSAAIHLDAIRKAVAQLRRQAKWHEAFARLLKSDDGGGRHQDNIQALMKEARECQAAADILHEHFRNELAGDLPGAEAERN